LGKIFQRYSSFRWRKFAFHGLLEDYFRNTVSSLKNGCLIMYGIASGFNKGDILTQTVKAKESYCY